jgi:hypothetical protein
LLPINFHKTFVPERRLIGELLHYAALGKAGSYQEISAETGIPMGESTGKVPAILDYARGMGLVELEGEGGGGTKKPVLTPFGRILYTEDRYMGLALSQWMAHIQLCRGDTGAKAWQAVFAKARWVLGSEFDKEQLENYLIGVFGPGGNRTGPLVRTYLDDAALSRARVLVEEGDQIARQKAPTTDSYAGAYSAIVLALMEAHFPGEAQVTLSEFDKRTLLFDACLWGQEDVETVCGLLDRKGIVTLDRQMRPWILERKAAADGAWARIYDDLV